jgi:hypothetical protein
METTQFLTALHQQLAVALEVMAQSADQVADLAAVLHLKAQVQSLVVLDLRDREITAETQLQSPNVVQVVVVQVQ